jgi:hypothetical protein
MESNVTKTTSRDEFLSLLKVTFGIKNLEVLDSTHWVAVSLLASDPNVEVGRMCKSTQKGVITDRRSKHETSRKRGSSL